MKIGKNKRAAVSDLLDKYVSEAAVAKAGIFDVGRMNRFIDDYHNDTDPVSLTRKDALLNHLIGLQILHHQFIETNAPLDSLMPIEPLVQEVSY